MSEHIVCPSGLSGTVRGLTVSEAEVLTDRKLIHEGTVNNAILNKAWESTDNPGPYSFVGDKPDWDQVLIADSFYAFLMVRVATYGPEYDFKVGCRGCSESISWSLKLDELPKKELPEETLEAFKSGQLLTAEMNGRRVRFQLLNGAKQRKMQKALRSAKNQLLVSLAQRIVEVEGEKNKMLWLRNLPMGKATSFLNVLDEQDGGIETNIEVICPSCGMVESVELPFGRREFWLPLNQGADL